MNGSEAEMVAEREARAQRALHAYRERRRHRRGEDTYFGSTECLLEAVEQGLDEEALGRRRVEVLREATDAGVPDELSVMLYEVARQEGLDPVLGLELVRSGLGVLPPPDGVDNAPQFETTDKYAPEWLQPAVPPDTLLRERTLRMSFRRLKRLLERFEEPEEALLAFAREPDVDHVGY